MEQNEIFIRYYSKPIPVMVDPGRSHPCYERDLLLGWIYQGKTRNPVLKKFPNAEIVAKLKPGTNPHPRTKLRRIQ